MGPTHRVTDCLRHAQDALGAAITTIADDPNLHQDSLGISKRLVRLILELQQLEAAAAQHDDGALRKEEKAAVGRLGLLISSRALAEPVEPIPGTAKSR